jgi:hypothetical protein
VAIGDSVTSEATAQTIEEVCHSHSGHVFTVPNIGTLDRATHEAQGQQKRCKRRHTLYANAVTYQKQQNTYRERAKVKLNWYKNDVSHIKYSHFNDAAKPF